SPSSPRTTWTGDPRSPASRPGVTAVNRDNLYPYLVPGLINPDWEPICVPVGHGVYAALFEDHESEHGIVHATVTPDQLRAAGLSAEEAHRIALDNLVLFA